jgi:predicted dehydrogenase
VTPRVLVIGAGSIGRRHAAHLEAAGAHVEITDPDPARAAHATAAAIVDPDALVPGAYDGVVVASPTRLHAEHATSALDAGAAVLVEKPIAARSTELDALLAAGDRVMVGYNLRFFEPVQRFMALVHGGEAGTVRTVRAWFGSHLPDWRPGTDYRESYSARADLGGGILLDAIHELDLLVWLLGDGFEVRGAVVDRIGALEIDVDDTAVAVLRHSSGAAVELSLDLLSRRYRRGLEVMGDDATIRLDWARQVLEVEDASGVRTSDDWSTVDGSYVAEAAHFLAVVAGDAVPSVDATTGAASLRLAEAIATAAR